MDTLGYLNGSFVVSVMNSGIKSNNRSVTLGVNKIIVSQLRRQLFLGYYLTLKNIRSKTACSSFPIVPEVPGWIAIGLIILFLLLLLILLPLLLIFCLCRNFKILKCKDSK